jgi:tRNA pseudouridine55 synthase
MAKIDIERDIVCIDKPVGWTSFDVVAKLRGQLSRQYKERTGEKRRIKVGHTGTLDPFATGLLVLAVGKATKTIQELTKLDKVYEVEAVLGTSSTTGDP